MRSAYRWPLWWASRSSRWPMHRLTSFGEFGVLALILSAPILLRWHHPLLVLSWNLPLVIFFLPGRPPMYLAMVFLSLGISVLQRAMNKNMRFIAAPQITMPLLCMAAVVLVTAKLTGGIGLHALGDPVMGGKKYVFLLAGILGYFALTAQRISPHQAGLYVALFFLSSCIAVMGDSIAFIPSSFYFIFLVVPAGYLRLYRLGKHHAFCRGRRVVLGGFCIYAGPVWNRRGFSVGQTMAGGSLHFFSPPWFCLGDSVRCF